jgi:AraC family transcriptional regulator
VSKNNDAVSDSRLRAGQFYGEVSNRLDLSDLVLSEVSHKSGRRLPSHTHQLANFSLLIKGDYVEYCGRRAYRHKPLTSRFHPPELEHWNQIGAEGSHFFTVELGLDWIRRFEEYAPMPDTVVVVEGGDLDWLTLRLWREVKARHTYSRLAVEGLVMTMLAEVGGIRAMKGTRAPKWLSRATDLLRAEFDQNVTVARVAAEVGVHPFHLSRVFRHFHQQTIGEYVKRLRVQFACRKLFEPERELAAVALAAGFADQSHFTRAFKEITGMTPGSFRIAVKTRNAPEFLDYPSG